MAHTIDSISITGLRKADINQLAGYIRHISYEGVYWGNRSDFMRRHAALESWIEGICELVNDPDTRIKR